MKNTIIINIDTEKDHPITISKPEEITPPPTNNEEAKEMILLDIKCVVEALCTMIHVASTNKYGEKKTLIEDSIIRLHSMIIKETNIEE
tara:strand:- start:6832 stop:7098 length:267 start_codon:yes stop_codon:yes gene_type:complete